MDAVLLDWMLPKKSGIAVLRHVRQTNQTLPVILMTAKSELDDKVMGLDNGADDYLTKPFETEELLARLRVVLRRQVAPVQTVFEVADLTLNTTTHRVQRGDQLIALTQREFDLLAFLMQHEGHVMPFLIMFGALILRGNITQLMLIFAIYVKKLRVMANRP